MPDGTRHVSPPRVSSGMSEVTLNNSHHLPLFRLSPTCLAQWLIGVMAGLWLSRHGEWAADWQARSTEGLTPDVTLSPDAWLTDTMLLPGLMLSFMLLLSLFSTVRFDVGGSRESFRGRRLRHVLKRCQLNGMRSLGALWLGIMLGLLHQPLLMPEALSREQVWLEGRVAQASQAAPSPRESARMVLKVTSCRPFAPSTANAPDTFRSVTLEKNSSAKLSGKRFACQRLEGQHIQLRRYWPRRAGADHAPERWQVGERWKLVARLVPVSGSSNPGERDAFDRVGWLWREGLVATGYVRHEERAQRLSSPQGLSVLRLRAEQTLWQRCEGNADRSIEDNIERGDEKGAEMIEWATSPCRWLAALTLGRASALTREDWNTLNATGLTHLAVVSGLHVGLMVSLMLLLAFGSLRLLRPADWRFSAAPWWLAFVAAWSFALLAGLAPPALRAALMASVGLWMASGRSGLGVWQVWMLALITVLVLDPLALWRPGTWLSFVAVAVLLLAWQGRARPRGLMGWCLATLRSQWLLSLAMGAALLVWRGQLSLLSLPMNLVMAPLVTLLVVPLGMLGWALAGIEYLLAASGFIPEEMAGISGAGLSGMLWQWLAHGVALGVATLTPIAESYGMWPSWDVSTGLAESWVLAAALVTLLSAWLASGVPGIDANMRRVCSVVAVIWGLALGGTLLMPSSFIEMKSSRPYASRSSHDPALSVTVHDVGQGLAVSLVIGVSSEDALQFLATPSVPRLWRYDLGAGSAYGAPRIASLLPSLSSEGASQGVIISHADEDHAGGVSALSAADIVELWVPDGQRTRLLKKAGGLASVPLKACVAGRKVVLGHVEGKSLMMEVLWPSQGLKTRNDNAHSCVVLIQHGTRPLALLTGDIRQQEERRIIAQLRKRLAGESLPLLIVAHHGSRSSSGDAWLEALSPRHAIISAGRYNPHGHPHDDVVVRLADHAECLWHSGLDGALRWEWSPAGEHLIPARGAAGISAGCLGVKSAD
ncbi:DNA internalization-related competence protein ComEC/Rec2 [Cobetia crustatorum]|uniref:DNA internalization-related competence protein ComEC/Rec2 n=3 Tax=Cobetia crustatorum TaxID=553385 RepID=A0A558HXA9_9GAMM|nr:DNA internalization-related competence protein ComEC/Rec2 [Cobetia crustatorum]